MPAKHQRREKVGIHTWIWKIVGVLLLVVSVAILYFSTNSRWNNQLPLNLVLAGNERIAVLQLDPISNKAKLLVLPDNLLLGVAGMGSQYQARSLWRLGEVESRPEELVMSTITAFTGVWIDGYVYDPSWEGGLTLNWRLLKERSITSNLNVYELGQIINFTNNLRSDQKLVLNLPESIQEEVSLVDGYKVVTVNERRLDALMRDFFATQPLLADKRTISVSNGSGVAGMARLMERIVTSSGGAVVEVVENTTGKGWCIGKYSGEETGIVSWLIDRLGCHLEKLETDQSSAEVEIMVGEEWGKRFNR